ncbi:Deoxyuridine 5'-triphosphate nucleotidohydrolase [Caloramator mitchellensis]|uniref:Deoxyuridine 5'-triphosphate nucleotidohydrolase n=1 Tax=Caloramator mitchellensis TaxID=908809 RepID=A0A0R3JTW8_CALMK|nr:dUTP diphosphatase [Caloramator mitchellensis]KRQ86999.1 Deoxyuridine 5'-triphosphate nucleotidohydrolase [Caloramator mitchellensis]
MKLYLKRVENAKDLPLPKYMTDGSAGMDLFANVYEEIVLEPNKIKLIPTGIVISLPKGFEAQIRPRSGLALKHGISLVNTPGTIDSDYRGEINVILINFGDKPFIIKRGDRIAQMVINRIELPEIVELNELDETQRGEKGFGSTGL